MPTWCQLLGFRSSDCPLTGSGFPRALDHPRGFNLLWPLGSGHSGAAVFQGYLIALSLQRDTSSSRHPSRMTQSLESDRNKSFRKGGRNT